MENEKLNRFAILTHTIGNLTIVPKNLTAGGVRSITDFGIIRLPNFSPEHDLDYHIRTYPLSRCFEMKMANLNPYGRAFTILPYPIYSETPEQVEAFLDTVTDQIIKRGERLVVRLKQEETA